MNARVYNIFLEKNISMTTLEIEASLILDVLYVSVSITAPCLYSELCSLNKIKQNNLYVYMYIQYTII